MPVTFSGSGSPMSVATTGSGSAVSSTPRPMPSRARRRNVPGWSAASRSSTCAPAEKPMASSGSRPSTAAATWASTFW
jgi:hypothetical protein